MAFKVPEKMKDGGRRPDPNFAPTELLYRRVPPDCIDGNVIHVDAVQLPDISTMREKYTETPTWALIDTVRKRTFLGWGVAAFAVGDVPPWLHYQGTQSYECSVVHCPESDGNNFPHAEVRAVDRSGVHVTDKSRLPREVQLNWRERLLRRTKIALRPASPADH